MTEVSIIIVSYNTADITLECIKSVYEKTQGVDFEVIVVDNNSQDGSAAAIEEAFPLVKVIKCTENLGFGRANNLGMKDLNSKYILLLNPDTVLKNNAVKILFDFMQENPSAGAAGGMLYDIEGRRTHSFGRLPLMKDKLALTFLPHIFLSKDMRNKFDLDSLNENRETGYITGADLMLRRSILEKTGVFDPDFFLYYEETEFQFRIKKAGYKIYIVPEAEIIHLEGKSLNKKSRREESYKSEYLYYKKCYKLTKFSLFKLAFFIYLFPRFFSNPKMILRVLKYVLGN